MLSQVGFNRLPEKVSEKVLGSLGAKPSQVQQGSEEGSGEGSGEGWGGFGAEPGEVQQGSGEGSGEGLGGFGAKAGQVQQGSGEGSGEGLGDFGAEPGQVQQGSGDGSGEGLRGYLVQSQVRCNRILKKVPQKVPEGFGAEPCQVQQGSRRRFRRRSGRLRCRVNRVPEEGSGEGLEGFGAESTGFRRRFRRRSGRLRCRAGSSSTGFAAI